MTGTGSRKAPRSLLRALALLCCLMLPVMTAGCSRQSDLGCSKTERVEAKDGYFTYCMSPLGLRDGPFVFMEFGKLKAKGQYVDGLQEGPMIAFSPEGKPLSQVTYVRGVLDPSSLRMLPH